MGTTDSCGVTPAGIVIVGLAMLALSGCSSEDNPVAADDLEYTSGLTVSVRASSNAEGLLPTVVLLHGAGLTRKDYVTFANQIAERDAVVFNADWSVLGPSRRSALEEIACLVRFARLRTPDFGGDPERVVLVGHSTATAYVGFVATSGDTIANTCGLDTSPLPDGLALLASATLPGGGLFPYSSFEGNPDLRVAVVHGTDDRVVSPSRSERMAAVWENAGYRAHFSTVPGGHYDLVGVPAGAEASSPTPPRFAEEAANTTISLILDLVSDTEPEG